jgi:hypothetical protein
MKVSGQRHAPASLFPEALPVPIELEAGPALGSILMLCVTPSELSQLALYIMCCSAVPRRRVCEPSHDHITITSSVTENSQLNAN